MKRIIYLLSLLALVFSCSKMEDGKSQGNYEMSDRVVANSPEVAPGTKTNVTGATVTWAAEDKIAIMGSVNCETEYVYKLESGANTKKAVFINEEEACPDENGLLAVYPSSMAYINSGNKYTYVNFPATQNYKEGGVATDLLAMYAKNTDKSSLQFEYLAGVLKLRLYAGEAKTIKNIRISNNSVPLMGNIFFYNDKTLKPSNDPFWYGPTWEYNSILSQGGKGYVDLSCNVTISTDAENPTDFNFVIPMPDASATLNNFSVIVETTDGASAIIASANAPVVQRGKILSSTPKKLTFVASQVKIKINNTEYGINDNLTGIVPEVGSTISIISPKDKSGNYTEKVSQEQINIALYKAEEATGKVNLDFSQCDLYISKIDASFSPFKWTKVSELKLPDCITSISALVFNGYSIDKLYISKNITSIGAYAMLLTKGNGEYVVSEDNSKYCSVDGALFSKNKEILYFIPNNLTTYSIPEGTKTVNNALYAHTALQELTLPKSLTAMGEESISGCVNLRLITSNSKKITMDGMQYYGAPGANVPSTTPLVVKVPSGCKATYETEWSELLNYHVASWGTSRWTIDDGSKSSVAGATLGTPDPVDITL